MSRDSASRVAARPHAEAFAKVRNVEFFAPAKVCADKNIPSEPLAKLADVRVRGA